MPGSQSQLCVPKRSTVRAQGTFIIITGHIYLGLSSVTTLLTKDRKSEQKFMQTVGFQQLYSFYMR